MAVDSGATTVKGGEATVNPPTNLPAHCVLKEASRQLANTEAEFNGRGVEALKDVTLIFRVRKTLHSLPNREM